MTERLACWYMVVISRGLESNIMRNTIVMNETRLLSAKSCRHGPKIASRFREISFVIDNNNNRLASQLDEAKAGPHASYKLKLQLLVNVNSGQGAYLTTAKNTLIT